MLGFSRRGGCSSSVNPDQRNSVNEFSATEKCFLMVTWKLKVSTFVPPAEPSIRFNEHLDEEDGPLVFEHACKLGLEGIV